MTFAVAPFTFALPLRCSSRRLASDGMSDSSAGSRVSATTDLLEVLA
jgi:hypothetical protein